MKIFKLILLLLLVSLTSTFAQVGVNSDGATPDNSAMLDVVSTEKGMLVPRMTQTQRDAITSPATGLLLFQTDQTAGFYYYNGSTWGFLGGTDDQTAAEVANTAAGNIEATTVQAAINELDSEKISKEVDGSLTNELQTLETCELDGTVLFFSLSNDGEATKTIELASLQDGTGTDDQTAAEVANTAAGNIEATTVQAAINELDSEKISKEVDGSLTNELQTLDVSELDGTTLKLSLSSDKEATKEINLADLQDGTGTDDQTAAEVANTAAGNIEATTVQAAINELDSEKLSSEVDGSLTNELQTLDVSELDGTTLKLSLSSDGEITKEINLASLQDGTGTDDQTLIEILSTNTSAGNNKITNLTDPTAAQDAATKTYVDAHTDSDSDATNELELPTSPTTGSMSYYDGSSWVSIAPGDNDQQLTFCKGQPIWTTDGKCPIVVGDFYQGGVIFYIFEEGDLGYVEGETHGLIAAKMNLEGDEEYYPWGCFDISGTQEGIGYGSANTDTIVINCDRSYDFAAKLCYDLVLDGYEDWFLPSKDELVQMYLAREIIDITAVENGGSTFGGNILWSSTETDSNVEEAFSVEFALNDITIYEHPKPVWETIRPVRAF